MSYKISYGDPAGKAMQRSSFRLRLPAAAGIVLALAILARIFYPNEAKQLTEALFPLTSAASQEALEVFAQNIKAGESFRNAVTAFCLEIIEDADIS